MIQIEQPGQLVYQIILVSVKSAIGVHHLPAHFDDHFLARAVKLLFDGIGKLPQIQAFRAALLSGLPDARQVVGSQAEPLLQQVHDPLLLRRGEFTVHAGGFKQHRAHRGVQRISRTFRLLLPTCQQRLQSRQDTHHPPPLAGTTKKPTPLGSRHHGDYTSAGGALSTARVLLDNHGDSSTIVQMHQTPTSPARARDRWVARIMIEAMLAASSVVTWLGYDRSLRLAARTGTVMWRVLRRLRERIHHNLNLAYGSDLSHEEQQAVGLAVMRNIAMNWSELFFAGGQRKQQVHEAISVTGREHLDRALAGKTGVIAVSAHYGNYPLVGITLARLGYACRVVVRDLASPAGSTLYAEARRRILLPALTTTPEAAFMRSALRLLRTGGILQVISDENRRRGGVFVNFFGRPAATPAGTAMLARRTGAPILPMFMVRNPDNTQTLHIEPPLHVDPSADTERDIIAITAAYTAVIERYIRAHPAQWLWTNWRWRTQPDGQVATAKLRRRSPLKRLRKAIKRRRRARLRRSA